MITAIVFVQADVARIPAVAQQIADLDGVSEVYSVTGQVDLIAMVRVRTIDQVATTVADQVNKVPGVEGTETHIAFRAYSTHDLEAAFKKYGVIIVKQSFDDTGGVLHVRVPKDVAQHWPLFIENAYRAADHHKWALDLSKYFYLDASTNSVRYLWRLVLRGASIKKLTTSFSTM